MAENAKFRGLNSLSFTLFRAGKSQRNTGNIAIAHLGGSPRTSTVSPRDFSVSRGKKSRFPFGDVVRQMLKVFCL